MFHSNGSSASLFFCMGMIWDHHIVQNNYGHHLPIGTPYQLLKHTCFTCSMEMVWDHLVTQENCGSKLPIVLPYQQLIHTLLYLCYGNDMGSFSYTGKLWEYDAHSYTIPAANSDFVVPALWK